MLAFFDRRCWLSLLANMASAALLAGVSNLFLFLVPDQGASLKTSSDEISGPVMRSTTLILIGNVLTIIAAVFVSWRVAAASRWSAVLTALVALWVTFATGLTLLQMRTVL